ncbi:MAG: hypothetical protein BJ554DRAFT_3541 [Olpidium bornovanus]|uniref:Uncharacterized protein n=1 Tax=Olpidium bornovanus TaxID=278681 RepID=A0A8H7ZP61_9FUNG|nr:MAG: hypothetical protein BJ554DRAFT_3541 [Olpidium bornovanus]
MLSTNSSTSWPSWSRKYSAMVRPVRATRARAPGGSFIWPKTSAALDSPSNLITPVVSLTGTLSNAGKHRVTSVRLGNVVDELLDKHGLANSGSSEEANLTTPRIWCKKIDDLDASFQNLGRSRLIRERRRVRVDRCPLLSLYGTSLVDRFPDDVHNATQTFRTDGNTDRTAGIRPSLAAGKTFRAVHGNSTDGVLTATCEEYENKLGYMCELTQTNIPKVLRHLENKTRGLALDLEGVQNRRKVILIELHVDDGTNDGPDAANALGLRRIITSCCKQNPKHTLVAPLGSCLTALTVGGSTRGCPLPPATKNAAEAPRVPVGHEPTSPWNRRSKKPRFSNAAFRRVRRAAQSGKRPLG